MRQAIITKYLGPTNTLDSRIKVFCDAESVTVSWDCELDVADNHTKAALFLANKLGWLGKAYGSPQLHGGGMPQSTPYAYCFVLVQHGK